MKTIELADTSNSASDLLKLADQQNILIRTPEGKIFVIAELGMSEEIDDFADEIARTRQNAELMDVLAERSRDQSRVSADEARKRLGL